MLRISISETFNESDVIERSKLVGQSFGAYGTVVTSDFSVKAALERPDRPAFDRTYQTKFNVVEGNRELPADLHPMSVNEGTQEFCDRLTFGFIRDLVRAGEQ